MHVCKRTWVGTRGVCVCMCCLHKTCLSACDVGKIVSGVKESCVNMSLCKHELHFSRLIE